jgi:hypothetical protein
MGNAHADVDRTATRRKSERSVERDAALQMQLLKVQTNYVAQFDMLELLPKPLVQWIEVRGVRGQGLHLDLPG